MIVVSKRGSSVVASLHLSDSPIIPSLMQIRHATFINLKEPVTCVGAAVIRGQDHHR